MVRKQQDTAWTSTLDFIHLHWFGPSLYSVPNTLSVMVTVQYCSLSFSNWGSVEPLIVEENVLLCSLGIKMTITQPQSLLSCFKSGPNGFWLGDIQRVNGFRPECILSLKEPAVCGDPGCVLPFKLQYGCDHEWRGVDKWSSPVKTQSLLNSALLHCRTF